MYYKEIRFTNGGTDYTVQLKDTDNVEGIVVQWGLENGYHFDQRSQTLTKEDTRVRFDTLLKKVVIKNKDGLFFLDYMDAPSSTSSQEYWIKSGRAVEIEA